MRKLQREQIVRDLLDSWLATEVGFTCAGRTDAGIIRSGNEDDLLMVPDRGIFIVADGIGGYAAGEVASAMAVHEVSRHLGSLPEITDEELGAHMRSAIRAANGAIFRRAIDEPDKHGMGTTVTALALCDTRFLIGHVGDCRAYLLRNAKLVQLTKDHTYVQELVDAGHLERAQARRHLFRNVITRCVGAKSDVIPDIHIGTVRPGDLFLLASDGLTGTLTDDRLVDLLTRDWTPQELVDVLIDEANGEGGPDNITAIVVRIDSVDASMGETPGISAPASAWRNPRIPCS